MTQKHTKHIRITGIHGTKAAHPTKTMDEQTGSGFQNMNRMRTIRVDGFMVRLIRSPHEPANFQFPSILRTPHLFSVHTNFFFVHATLQFFACGRVCVIIDPAEPLHNHFGLDGSSSLHEKFCARPPKLQKTETWRKGSQFALCCPSPTTASAHWQQQCHH